MTASPVRSRLLLALGAALTCALLAGCDEKPRPRTPEEVRAQLVRLLPGYVRDRRGWAKDFQTAFASLEITPSDPNLCAALSVAEQESTFSPDPAVPGLGRIALTEIDRRAVEHHVPPLLVHAALLIHAPDGQPWQAHVASVRTEKELSDVFETMIAQVPMGRRLLAAANPVRTAGPMQVSIAFSERLADDRTYPYAIEGSIRHEVFTRRGGVYFGTAHLLGYRASYPSLLYRFADYNAGWYASRNAAFQRAVSTISGAKLSLDGDLVRYGSSEAGDTERALRSVETELGMDDAQIHRALLKAGSYDFEKTDLYQRVFDMADGMHHGALPRARLPEIRLSSPKITRHLTTEWFATRVEQRYRACMARARSGR